MRRIICVCLALCLLLTGCTFSQQEESSGIEVSFYYGTRDVDQLIGVEAVQSEQRTLWVYTLNQLLEVYFEGPDSEALFSPFPAGTQVLAVGELQNGLKLTMSGEFFTLQGIELSIASCCLAQTVCAYTGVAQITLVDEMERIHLELYPDNFLLTNALSQDTDTAFTLYFSDGDRRYLISEIREATLSDNESQEAYVLRQMMEGPQNNGLLPVIPEGTVLLHVETEDGICTVNFSKEFYENRLDDTYGAYTTIYGITNTLTNLENVSAVQFLVDGETINNYGIFPLEQPVARNSGAIGPVRANGSELDINLYVMQLEGDEPFAFPTRVKQTISQPLAEAVAQAALNYEPPQGFYNPIPFGTELLGISVSGSVCYVDLSDKFIPAEDTEATEKAAVWALVTTLTDLDNISSVVLTINGDSGGLHFVDISEPLTEKTVAS